MARQSITPNRAQKLFEAYMDFSGGMNSETSNERLRDNEFPLLQNVELSSRGSAKRRSGRFVMSNQSVRGQGAFFFYRTDTSKPDTILAAGGTISVRENGGLAGTRSIPIVDGAGTLVFQNTKPIEAVQYGSTMFIATGTKLCELTCDPQPNWAGNTAYTTSQKVNSNGSIYQCTGAGTSDATGGTGGPQFTNAWTNLLTANQSSIETDTTGFTPFNSPTLTRTTAQKKSGAASLQVVCPGVGANEALWVNSTTVPASQTYTASMWMKGSGQINLSIDELTSADVNVGTTTTSTFKTLSSTWQLVTITRTFGSTGVKARLRVVPISIQAITYYVDEIMLETGSSSHSWVLGGAPGFSMDGTVTWQYMNPTWNAKTVTPYQPTVLEAIYIGTNGLAASPDSYVADGTGTLEAIGIKPAVRTGTVNKITAMTAYVNKPAPADSTDYRWEYKKAADTTWIVGRDWTADGSGGKSYNFLPDTATKWDIRVTIRKTATTTPTPQYAMTNFVVNQTEDKNNTSRPVSGIQTCRKIMLHWDRLLLSGDASNYSQVYISDLNAPRYFPTTNTISFDTGKQEAITSMVRYRDMLVVFSKTTIQALTGKSPETYQRILIHDSIGSIAERSAQVAGNNILFLSAEGVHMLKPNALTLDMMNVQRIDYPIKSQIATEIPLTVNYTGNFVTALITVSDACSMVYDNQYWLCFPASGVIYRFYYDNGAWVQDTNVVSSLRFIHMIRYGEYVWEFSIDGQLYLQDKTRWTDEFTAYVMVVETKNLDLSASFNFKKLKRLYVLARHFNVNVHLNVTVKADSQFVLNPTDGATSIINGNISWFTVTSPNMHFYAGTVVGSWVMNKTPLGSVDVSVQKAQVRGSCRRVKLIFMHDTATPCEIFGFGLEFKERKP